MVVGLFVMICYFVGAFVCFRVCCGCGNGLVCFVCLVGDFGEVTLVLVWVYLVMFCVLGSGCFCCYGWHSVFVGLGGLFNNSCDTCVCLKLLLC